MGTAKTLLKATAGPNPIMSGSGLASLRKPQEVSQFTLPANLRVVSADNHCEITRDIFYENFPASMRDRAPRVWFDRCWRIGYPDAEETFAITDPLAEMLERVVVRDGFDSKVRNEHMDAEGVHAEIVFPQSLFGFLRHKDLEVRERMYRVYNDYIAGLSTENPGRFYGVGVFSNWWEPEKAEGAIKQIMDLDLKTFMVPTTIKDVSGREISFAAKEMDRFWAVAEASGLPVNFHIGEDLTFEGPGTHGAYFMTTTSPFRKPLAQMIFGGVFDKHPNLKVVFSEAGINWVAGFLQDAELYHDTYGKVAGSMAKHRPSHYWNTHCYATFQVDKLGLENLDYIGSDRIMWAVDYPHSEGSFGMTGSAMQEVLRCTSEAETRAILGGTAEKVYKL